MIENIFDEFNFPLHETHKLFSARKKRQVFSRKHTRKMLKVEIMIFSL